MDPARAEALEDEALELAGRSPARLELAQVRLARGPRPAAAARGGAHPREGRASRRPAARGLRLRRAGERTRARAELEQALGRAAACQAGALVLVARAELHLLGARPRRLAFTGVASLTRAERRVVDLAAAGRTNREIAQELWTTVKTVDSHMGRAFRKLGVARRTQPGRRAGSSGGDPRCAGGRRART